MDAKISLIEIIENTVTDILQLVRKYSFTVWHLFKEGGNFVKSAEDAANRQKMLSPYPFLFYSSCFLFFAIRLTPGLSLSVDFRKFVSYSTLREISVHELLVAIIPTMAVVVLLGLLWSRITTGSLAESASPANGLFVYLCGYNFAVISLLLLLSGVWSGISFLLLMLPFGSGSISLSLLLVPFAAAAYLLIHAGLVIVAVRRRLPASSRRRGTLFLFLSAGLAGVVCATSFGVWNSISPVAGREIVVAMTLDEKTVEEPGGWVKHVTVLLQNNTQNNLLLETRVHTPILGNVEIWRNDENKDRGYFVNRLDVLSASSGSADYITLKPNDPVTATLRIKPFKFENEEDPHWPGDVSDKIKRNEWLYVKHIRAAAVSSVDPREREIVITLQYEQ